MIDANSGRLARAGLTSTSFAMGGTNQKFESSIVTKVTGVFGGSSHKIRGIVGSLLAAVFLSSCADLGTTKNPNGKNLYVDKIHVTPYVVAGRGTSSLTPNTSRVPGTTVSEPYNDGEQLTIGFDVSKHLSLEVHSTELGSAGLSSGGRIDYQLKGGSALFYVGKNRHRLKRKGLTGYGRIGYGVMENSAVGDVSFETTEAEQVMFGAGLEYMTRFGIGLRAEAMSFNEDVQYAQVGLLVRFGKNLQTPPLITATSRVDKREPLYIPPQGLAFQIPETGPVTDPCAKFTGVLKGVKFYSDSDELSNSAKQVLFDIVDSINECGSPMLIKAHTDSKGDSFYNMELSFRRAHAVANFLIDFGIDINQLEARAFGESQPIESNETEHGRHSNRRVEMIAQ